MIQKIAAYLNVPEVFAEKILFTLLALFLLTSVRIFVALVVNRKIQDDKRRYHIRRTITYVYTILLLMSLGSIWFRGIASLTTIFGLASAGLAV